MTAIVTKKTFRYTSATFARRLLHKVDITTLKKLVGNELWGMLNTSIRKTFGKEFKYMVKTGEISGLAIGNKKSSNEQQYIRI